MRYPRHLSKMLPNRSGSLPWGYSTVCIQSGCHPSLHTTRNRPTSGRDGIRTRESNLIALFENACSPFASLPYSDNAPSRVNLPHNNDTSGCASLVWPFPPAGTTSLVLLAQLLKGVGIFAEARRVELLRVSPTGFQIRSRRHLSAGTSIRCFQVAKTFGLI